MSFLVDCCSRILQFFTGKKGVSIVELLHSIVLGYIILAIIFQKGEGSDSNEPGENSQLIDKPPVTEEPKPAKAEAKAATEDAAEESAEPEAPPAEEAEAEA